MERVGSRSGSARGVPQEVGRRDSRNHERLELAEHDLVSY